LFVFLTFKCRKIILIKIHFNVLIVTKEAICQKSLGGNFTNIYEQLLHQFHFDKKLQTQTVSTSKLKKYFRTKKLLVNVGEIDKVSISSTFFARFFRQYFGSKNYKAETFGFVIFLAPKYG